MSHRSNATVKAARLPPPSRPRTSSGAAPANIGVTAGLETLIDRRVALLTSLALIYADEGRRLDLDPFGRPTGRGGADLFEQRASTAEAELEEIENRLAEAAAAGLRPRRWRRR